jgi:hypothetical protein
MSREPIHAAFPARPAGRAHACRLCGQPLSALARQRGDVCDAMDCRRRAADAVTRARRNDEIEALRTIAAREWALPDLARAPVLWLRHHEEDFATPSPIDIGELREHLMALEAEAIEPPALADAVPAPESSTAALGGQLCALCRGRCCRFGLHGRAFLRAPQLRDWLAERPGTPWADAVDHYLGLVPSEHLHSSCLFHARDGCALPRERRSQVCNDYACDTLEQLRDVASTATSTPVVVGIAASHELHGAAMLSLQGGRPLPAPSGPAQLP